MNEFQVGVASGIAELSPAAWDALVPEDHPFVGHRFLGLLESSGSVGPGTGWQPQYLFVREAATERLVGATPTYLKTDSYGEYIFDWGWARAAEQAGIPYYPKLPTAVPFTPATGPRLLVAPNVDRARVEVALLKGLSALEKDLGAWSSHFLFTLDDEAGRLETAGFLRRSTHQYHWRNDAYRDFDDFLERFRSAARKEVKKERRRAADSGLQFAVESGDALSDADWRAIEKLYRNTSDRKWGRPYLSADFFEQLGPVLGSQVRVATARQGRQIVAMALAFQRGLHLYGRHWGASVEVRDLHFELCYYQLIEHAIREGLKLFEAGAQGEHKLRRGFVPVVVHSNHRFRVPGLSQAVARFLAEEREALEGHMLPSLLELVPFKDGLAPNLPLVAGRSLRPQ